MSLAAIITQLITFIRMTIMDAQRVVGTVLRLVAWLITVHPAVFFALAVIAVLALFATDHISARK